MSIITGINKKRRNQMLICRFCGAEIADSDPFCANCGAPVLKEGETIEPVRIDAPEEAVIIISEGPEMSHEEARRILKKRK